MERNNRTPTIIFSYFKPHPTLDTNLELNAELLLLFSFTYDSFLPRFPDCKCSLWGSSATSSMHGVCCRQQPHQAACCWCGDWQPRLIARFKLGLLEGKTPSTNWDAKPARSEWILNPNITEVYSATELRGAVAQMCPFRGHWPRTGGFMIDLGFLQLEKTFLSRKYSFLLLYNAQTKSYGDAVLMFVLKATAESQGAVFQGHAKGNASAIHKDSDLERRP